jgi:hypothetical protein
MLPSYFAYTLYIIHYRIRGREHFKRGGPPASELFMLVPTPHHKGYVKAATKCYTDRLSRTDCLVSGRALQLGRVNTGGLI